MPLCGTRNDENRLELVSAKERGGHRATGRCLTGAFEPAGQSDRDADTYPELLPPVVGEHAEQSVLPCGIPRRLASLEEVRHGHDVL